METPLHKARQIILTRCDGGWIVRDESESGMSSKQPLFCFESTASLAKHLVALLRETKWTVQELVIPRRPDGKFTKKTE